MNTRELGLLIMFLALGIGAEAQVRRETIQIFFGSGSANIDANQQIRLDSLIKAAAGWGEYEWKISAYTDDQGQAARNQKLSEERAAAVSGYLKTKGLSPKKATAEGHGAALAKSRRHSAIERAQMRRVDIDIVHINLRNLTDFYNYTSERSSRFYEVTALNQTQTIRGEQGGGVSLPANAFVRADGGAVVGPVEIELREAYSFGDMILQQLGTSAQGRLLETGGMMYISATDATGAALQLGEGKKMEIMLPQRKGLSPDMQVFVADRAGDHPEEDIDWQATNTPFQQRRRMSFRENFIDIPRLGEPAALPRLEVGDYKRWFPKGKMPILDSNTYTAPKKPDMPELRGPNMQDLREEMPKNFGETDKHYNRRLQDEYAARQADYEKAYETDRAKQKAYRDSLDAYQKNINKQAASIRRYNLYADSLGRGIDSIFFNYYMPLESHLAWLKQAGQASDFYYSREFAFARANILGLDAGRAEFAELKRSQDSLLADLEILDKSLEGLPQFASQWEQKTQQKALEKWQAGRLAPLGTRLFEFRHRDVVNKWNTNERLRYLYKSWQLDSIMEMDFGAYCYKYYKEEAPKLQAFVADSLPKMMEEAKNTPAARCQTQAERCNNRHYTIRVRYQQKKEALKELTADEQLTAIAEVSRLGWINCDKFQNFAPEDCYTFTLRMPNETDTKFYIILPTISSILPLAYDGAEFNTRQYKGIPKRLQAKLVGIRVKDGKTSLYIHEAQADKLGQGKIEFTPCTFEEAMARFASL